MHFERMTRFYVSRSLMAEQHARNNEVLYSRVSFWSLRDIWTPLLPNCILRLARHVEACSKLPANGVWIDAQVVAQDLHTYVTQAFACQPQYRGRGRGPFQDVYTVPQVSVRDRTF